MAHFQEAGQVVTLTLATATVAGEATKIGDHLVGYPSTTRGANEPGAVVVPGCAGKLVDVTKHGAAGRDWALGERIYFDSANSRYTDDSGVAGGVAAGVAAAAADAAAVKGEILVVSGLG